MPSICRWPVWPSASMPSKSTRPHRPAARRIASAFASHRNPESTMIAIVRGVLAAVFVAAVGLAAAGRAQTPADLSALAFLLGDWDAVGLPRGESGAFNFSLAVQDRIIVRTNYAKYPARDGKPATRHDDLMVIFMEDGAIKA